MAATKGVLIFQEQILRVAREIAGLSWAEADQLRKGMSKFQPEEMTAHARTLYRRLPTPCPAGPGFTPEQAHTLWEQVQAFAGYGFNQGHATAYADVSYRSAYLKTHWPAAFLARGWPTGAAFTTRPSTSPRPCGWALRCARPTSTTAAATLPCTIRKKRRTHQCCGWGWARCGSYVAPPHV